MTSSKPVGSHTSDPFRIVGYLPDWDGVVDPNQLALVTHVNYAFVIPNADGSLVEVANDAKLKSLVREAHAHGVKVLISVGGWGHERAFQTMATDALARTRFVSNIVAFAERFLLDGIDIDWEYPQAADTPAYNQLMKELRVVQTARQKLLTIAVVSYGGNAEGTSNEVLALCDFVNLMAYDGSPAADHSTLALAEESLMYWRNRGLPGEKINLGVPFYSRPGEIPFRKVIESAPDARNLDQTDVSGVINYYNGLPTMRAKTALARKLGNGIMIWHIGQDAAGDASLLRAIARESGQSVP